MNSNQETEAYGALAEWMKRADTVRQMFEALGTPVPTPLRRFFNGGGPEPSSIPAIPPPPTPPRPGGAKEDWICVEAVVVSAKALLLAVLREAYPNTVPDAVNRVVACRPDRPKGSIYNATKALSDEGLIERAEGGWRYCGDDDEHPVFAPGSTARRGWVWGPLAAFSKQDIAHHRRRAICHILALESRGGGLMTTQIVAKLQDAKDWMRAPVSKDLVKMDMEALRQAGEVRRMGNSRKWGLKEEVS